MSSLSNLVFTFENASSKVSFYSCGRGILGTVGNFKDDEILDIFTKLLLDNYRLCKGLSGEYSPGPGVLLLDKFNHLVLSSEYY